MRAKKIGTGRRYLDIDDLSLFAYTVVSPQQNTIIYTLRKMKVRKKQNKLADSVLATGVNLFASLRGWIVSKGQLYISAIISVLTRIFQGKSEKHEISLFSKSYSISNVSSV